MNLNQWSSSTFNLYLFILFLIVAITYFSADVYYEDGMRRYKLRGKRLFIAIVPLLATLSIRSIYNGTDLYKYYSNYLNLDVTSIKDAFLNSSTREPLFNLIQLAIAKIAELFGLSTSLPFFVGSVALIWLMFSFFAIKREANRNGIVLAVAVLFIQLFFTAFSMLRQVIAISMVLLAFTYLADSRKRAFWVLILLAIGVHYTACIGIAAYFFVGVESDSRIVKGLKKCLVIMIMLAFFLFGASILNTVFGEMESKYSTLGTRSSAFGLGNLITRMPFLILLFLFKKELINQNCHNKIYIDLILLDVFVGQLNYVDPSFNRLSLYFAALKVFLLPSLYQVLGQKYGRQFVNFVFLIVILTWLILRIRYYVYTNPYGIMPFMTSFS